MSATTRHAIRCACISKVLGVGCFRARASPCSETPENLQTLKALGGILLKAVKAKPTNLSALKGSIRRNIDGDEQNFGKVLEIL